MQPLKFERAPEGDNNAYIIKMLEAALEEAKKGEISLAVLVMADDEYQISVDFVTDSLLELPGMLSTALRGV